MGARLFTPRHLGDFAMSPVGRGREACALLLLAVALYVSLALASLAADPTNPVVHGGDWVGPVGAQTATVLVQGFGVVAWLVPIELLVCSLPLLRRQPPVISAFRLSGDLLAAIIVAALVQVAAPDATFFGEMRAGGNVGLLFGEIFRALFSTVGSFLIASTSVALILIGRSSFSFIELCEKSLALARRVATAIGVGWHRLEVAWVEARALRRERADAAREERAAIIDDSRSDQAIIAQLGDDETPGLEWVPFERTGAPPLVLSETLRARRAPAADLLAADGPVVPSEPSVSPVVPFAPAKAAPSAAAPAVPPTSELVTFLDAEPAIVPPVTGTKKREAVPAKTTGPTIVDTSHLCEVRPVKKPRRAARGQFLLPDTDLLAPAPPKIAGTDRGRMLELADKLVATLANYGVVGKVDEIHPGPTVTTYEVTPEAGTKVSKVASLSDDLALGLSRKVRIIAPIPGKARIGFEVPNDARVPVSLRELIEDRRFHELAEQVPLPVVMGRDIVGAPYYADLASMPHVIVAGATGAGKSVGLNVMLSSLLFKRSPDDLRLLMIDPKVVELAPFDRIPHMLLPVVTDMKQAVSALKWAVDEMERRYQAFASAGTKNIATYNRWAERVQSGELPAPSPTVVEAITADGGTVCVPAARTGEDGKELPGRMPHIVIVVDEFADLMMQQGKEVEACVARLAQKARAAGMHVILATQRPSVDVITGMIKANFPTRVAFRVAQKVDSRTILDEMGAELLLGRGDMLVKMNGAQDTVRVQCPFISEEEVNALTNHLRKQGEPEYHEDILANDGSEDQEEADSELDNRFDEAVRIVADTQRCSTSWLQRKMTIGYNRAAKIVEAMERRGIVGPPNGSKDREVFAQPQ